MIAGGHKKVWKIDGTTLTAEISPCSWTCPIGMQISVTMSGGHPGGQVSRENTGGRALVCNRDGKSITAASEADFNALCAQVRLVACPGCQAPAFDPNSVSTNRGGKCEQCFLAEIDMQEHDDDRIEVTGEASEVATALANGFTHRVVSRVHLESGCDQRVVLYYRHVPAICEIEKELSARGSTVFDDFIVTVIAHHGPSNVPSVPGHS